MTTQTASGSMSFLSGKPLRFIAAGILLINGLFPALWILFTSLKTEAELTAKPITWIPHAPTLQNYMQAFSDQPLHIFLFNSFMVALLSTALTLLVSVLAAYALARLNLAYRGLILSLIIAVSTFPLVTLLVPLFGIQAIASRIISRNTAYVDLKYRQALALSTTYQAGVIGWVAFWALYGSGFAMSNLANIATFAASYALVIVIEPLADLAVLALAKSLRGVTAPGLVTPRLHNAA